MRIVVIGAMQEEIKFLLAKIKDYKEVKFLNSTFYEGTIFGKNIIVTASGIGKVASGLLVSTILAYYKDIDLIINVGVSGGVKNKVEIADVVVANGCKYADVDVTIFPKYEYGQMPGCPNIFPTAYQKLTSLSMENEYKLGMIISGDKFYHDDTEVTSLLRSHFANNNVLCLDMESTALAHASWFYNIDYLAIRAISDIIGSSFQKDEYEKNLEKACFKSNLFLLEVLEKIENK